MPALSSEAPQRQLIARLAGQIDETLRPLLANQRRFALLDFPTYGNVGDHAIWLGQIAYLHSIGVRRLCYVCDLFTYSREQLRARLGDGTILLCGGGGLGDLYPPYQRLREEIIDAFRDNAIIQLPQTIHFEAPAALARARRIINGHPRITLLVRDRRSLDVARAEFGAPSFLCPDMSFCIGPLRRPSGRHERIVWLARTDREAVAPAPRRTLAGITPVDWAQASATWLRTADRVARALLRRAPALRKIPAPMAWSYTALARERLRFGARLLGAARVVVTDRLHGHILSVLLGVPHILLDNSYGKNRNFYETWTRECDLVRWCDSEAQASAMAAAGWDA
ncbi:MAG TPA: polysaccharide pyruvyl transferase family protein [Candidatus Acidoferrales bacterium]|nr:polysaccharide pyruvyl transferase family protein [Candidatus Acidoferrales bacterium]